MMRNLRKRRNDFESAPEITLTPLIDTALVLLVIFMVATPIMHNSIKVDLPKGSMKESNSSNNNQVIISIDRFEQLYLNGNPIPKDSIVIELNKKLASCKDKVVFLNGDGNTSYKSVAELVDRIKYAAGVEHVILGLEKA